MTQHKMKERQERMKGWEKDREQGDPDSKPPCIYKGDTVGHRQQARRLQRKVYISSFSFSTISLRLSTPCCMSSRLFWVCSRVVSTSSVTPYTSPTCQSTTLHIELRASPMHLQSSSAYSDTLRIRLCMLCNSTLPPASMPSHVPPLLVCLFVCLPLSLAHVLLVLFVCFPFWIGSIN